MGIAMDGRGYLRMNRIVPDDPNQKKCPRGNKRLQRFELNEVLPFIGLQSHIFETASQRIQIPLSSQRMQLLGRTQSCACCCIPGRYFWLETTGRYDPHFNLYAINEHGAEVLMTMDHIIPASKGGMRVPENLQLLCRRCNGSKKDDILTIEELWARIFCPPKIMPPSQIGKWVKIDNQIGRIDRLERNSARVRLWCSCMTTTGRSREAIQLWRYGSFTHLTDIEIRQLKVKHHDCWIIPRYGNEHAEIQTLIGHIQAQHHPRQWHRHISLGVFK